MQATATTHNVLLRQVVSTTPSIVPLTTITTYPASCSDILWSYVATGGALPTYFKEYRGFPSECHPPEWGNPAAAVGVMKLYSPGVCPSGWVIASQSFDNDLGATAAYCCPRGTPILDSYWGDSTKVCSTVVTTLTSASSGSATVITSLFSGLQWAVPIAWAESDLASFTPPSAPLLGRFDASATSSAATAPTATATATSSTATAQPTITSNGTGGLSTGAQAGIGVGVAIIVLAALTGLLFFHRRRKYGQVPEISSSERPRSIPRPRYKDKNDRNSGPEMQSGKWLEYHEMNAQTNPSELQGSEILVREPYRWPT